MLNGSFVVAELLLWRHETFPVACIKLLISAIINAQGELLREQAVISL